MEHLRIFQSRPFIPSLVDAEEFVEFHHRLAAFGEQILELPVHLEVLLVKCDKVLLDILVDDFQILSLYLNFAAKPQRLLVPLLVEVQ